MSLPSAAADVVPPRSAAFRWIGPGLVLAASYAWLADQSRKSVGADLVDLALTVGAFCVVGAWLYAAHAKRPLSPPPVRGILAFSFLFHLIGVWGAPVLEDDYHRYLLDGWVFAETGSPYGVPPAAFFEVEGLPTWVAAALDGVNNPELTTIYGPTTEWVFRAAHRIAPGDVRGLQAIMALLSFSIVVLLATQVKPWPLLFFAWHPLLIKEFAFTAHPDVLAVLFLLLAVRLRRDRVVATGIYLGLAVGAKLFALLLAPALLISFGKAGVRDSIKGVVAFAVTLAVLYLPFVTSIVSQGELSGSPHWAMGAGWIFNAPIYVLGQPLVGAIPVRLAVGLGLGLFVLWWTHASLVESKGRSVRGDRLFGCMLLCAPVLNPWYLLWPFVFWPVRPTGWLAVASLAVFLSYGTGLHLGDPSLAAYEIPKSVLGLEFGLIGLAFARDVSKGRA